MKQGQVVTSSMTKLLLWVFLIVLLIIVLMKSGLIQNTKMGDSWGLIAKTYFGK